MNWLALEFSSDRRSVAVMHEGSLTERFHQGTLSTPIFKLIAEALNLAHVDRSQIEAIAIGVGPGSYTGVRLALSVAQGWSLATPVRVCGINSLECLAVAAAGLGPALLAVDAQRGEFAAAMAERGRLVEPMRLQTLEEIRNRSAEGIRVGGPEIAGQVSGAVELFPNAGTLVQLAAANPVFVPVEQLSPVYLRDARFVKAPSPRKIV